MAVSSNMQGKTLQGSPLLLDEAGGWCRGDAGQMSHGQKEGGWLWWNQIVYVWKHPVHTLQKYKVNQMKYTDLLFCLGYEES